MFRMDLDLAVCVVHYVYLIDIGRLDFVGGLVQTLQKPCFHIMFQFRSHRKRIPHHRLPHRHFVQSMFRGTYADGQEKPVGGCSLTHLRNQPIYLLRY